MNNRLGMVLADPVGMKKLLEYGLNRAELIIFNVKEKDNLTKFLEQNPIRVSAHCPIFIPQDYPVNPLLASLIDFDEERRETGLDMMEATAREAVEYGAKYVVVHIQRPEHFGGPNPAGASERDAMDVAFRSCDRLAEISDKYKIPFYVENQMDNSLFHNAGNYVELLEAYPRLGFCFDVGHLDVDARVFDFSFDEFLDQLLPYVKAVHLQNSNSRNAGFENRHWKIPVHPDQKPEDGWRDIESILRKILGYNSECIINFEARPDDVHDFNYMREGILWVRDLIPGILEDGKRNDSL